MAEPHIGFTGTQVGMTDLQWQAVRYLLPVRAKFVLHHGDCIGADAEVHSLVTQLDGKVIIHPPVDKSKRAFCKNSLVRKPFPYLERNQHIVDEGKAGLIAAPMGKEHNYPRSGTWATVRMARRAGRFIGIAYPDGNITTENGPRPW